MATVEFRFTEVEVDGRTLEGTAMPYGNVATLPGGVRERFEAGSFVGVEQADITLNVQHSRDRLIARSNGGGLVVSDSPERLSIKATLPQTREADDTLELVKAKILRGLSVGFVAVKERIEGGVRVIEQAALRSVAVVDSGAYPAASITAREAADATDDAERDREGARWQREFML